MSIYDDRFDRLHSMSRSRRAVGGSLEDLTAEWFPEQRGFYDDVAQLVAAVCGRRAGKTRGGCRHFVREARRIPGARLLYLNSTRGEAQRLAWYGNRDDGMAALVAKMRLPAKLDQAALTIHFTDNDSWIYLRGADDEAELRKALGGAYHEAWWDEAQKIPPKLKPTIQEVFMPALLDFGGRLRFTGTTARQMSGLFYDITRPEPEKRMPGWSVHHWTLLDNPFFGATREERWQRGIVGTTNRMGLQGLLGGPLVAPIDSPMMQREAFGKWVREDANFVYAVNKVPARDLWYAPPRYRTDGFPDIPAALRDLPWDWREGMFALGADLGYRDPFSFVLWGWHGHDRKLYEVASWKRSEMTSDEQVKALHEVRKHVSVGIITADAGGGGKQVVVGWSREWVERYNLPIIEAEKQHKGTFIEVYNNDILTGGVAFREDSPLFTEMAELQWATVASGSGRMVEDPTMDNHCCDASLYAHRHSFQYRWRPEDKKPIPGTPEAFTREEQAIEEDLNDEDETDIRYH